MKFCPVCLEEIEYFIRKTKTSKIRCPICQNKIAKKATLSEYEKEKSFSHHGNKFSMINKSVAANYYLYTIILSLIISIIAQKYVSTEFFSAYYILLFFILLVLKSIGASFIRLNNHQISKLVFAFYSSHGLFSIIGLFKSYFIDTTYMIIISIFLNAVLFKVAQGSSLGAAIGEILSESSDCSSCGGCSGCGCS